MPPKREARKGAKEGPAYMTHETGGPLRAFGFAPDMIHTPLGLRVRAR